MKKAWYLGFILMFEAMAVGYSDAYHHDYYPYGHRHHHEHHQHRHKHRHHQHHHYYHNPHCDQCWRHPWRCAPRYTPPPLIMPAPSHHRYRYPLWKKQLCRERYWSCRDAYFSVNTCLEEEAGCLRE